MNSLTPPGSKLYGEIASQGARSSPIACYVLRHNANALPGCSLAEPQPKPMRISNDMMQAYVMMRGPSMGFSEGDDPLFEWIRLREDLQGANKRSDDARDITRMLNLMDQSLLSENPAGDTPRTAVFTLRRPPIEHIQPPDGMDLSMHVLNACCADFEFEDDEDGEDDEEHYVPRGRISPCTFLAWSQDCKRWDINRLKAPTKEASPDNGTRKRPPTPEVGDTPPIHPRPERWPAWAIGQVDQDYGYKMSPHYPVPQSPSVMWTAEGIDADRMNQPDFEEVYSRMDPIAAMSFRKLKQYGRPNSESAVSPVGKDEHYTYSEIESVVAEDIHGLADGFEITHVLNHIGTQYAGIAAAAAEVKILESNLREQASQIRSLHLQKEQLLRAVWGLKNKRLEEAGRSVGRRDEGRRRRIRKHFRDHVSDVDYKYQQSMARLRREGAMKEDNDAAIERLEDDIFEACLLVGKNNPEEVYEELSNGPNPYLLREPTVDGFCEDGEQLGRLELAESVESDFTGTLAKPSPLQLVQKRDREIGPLEFGVQLSSIQRVECHGKEYEKQQKPVVQYGPVAAATYIDDYAVQPPTHW